MLGRGGARRSASRRLLAGLTDERLVALVRRGNESAFEELFDRHSAGVLSFCSRLLCGRDEGEDAHQQAFLAVYQAIGERGFEPRAFKPWLYTVARNRCLSMLRSRREAALPPDEESVVAAEHTADRVEQRAEVRELLSDVSELPEPQRAALLLSEVSDLSHAEIAQVIDCPREKVKSLVFQARASLSLRREARETPCGRVREQLAGLAGSRPPVAVRRHLKRCEGCNEFASEVRRRRELMAIALPLAPSIGLKQSVLASVGGGSGGGGGGLAAPLAAKGGSTSGASGGVGGGTAGSGSSAVAKAGLVVGAAAAATALSLAGAGAIREPSRSEEGGRSTSASEDRSSAAETRTSSPHAGIPQGDGRARVPERRRHPNRPSKAPRLPAEQAPTALLHPTPVREGRSPDAPRAVRAPVPGSAVRVPNRDRGRGGPQPDQGVGGRQPDLGVGRPQPDQGVGGPQTDLAKRTCDERGGLFVDVSRLVYACVFAQSILPQGRDQAGTICERSGGLFVDVSPLVYACVLPGGTLPDPFPALR